MKTPPQFTEEELRAIWDALEFQIEYSTQAEDDDNEAKALIKRSEALLDKVTKAIKGVPK
jgi:hypothetical protein